MADYKKYKRDFRTDEEFESYKSCQKIKRVLHKYIKVKRRERDIRYRFVKCSTCLILSLYAGIIINNSPFPALAVKVPDFVTKSYEDFINIRNTKDCSDYKGILNNDEPGFIPEGYSEISRECRERYMDIIYVKENKYIKYSKMIDSEIYIDSNSYQDKRNNENIFINSAKENNTILWSEGDIQCILTGSESFENLLIIKESIK